MKKRIRFISMTLCIAVVLLLVLSAAFMITHADHDCIGRDCETCHHIQRCQQTLKKALPDTASLTGIACTGTFYVLIPIDFQDDHIDKTLVGMKVKLSC